jgi:hypothetical protein
LRKASLVPDEKVAADPANTCMGSSTSTGQIKLYPCPITVRINRGFLESSRRIARSLLTAVLILCSASTKTVVLLCAQVSPGFRAAGSTTAWVCAPAGHDVPIAAVRSSRYRAQIHQSRNTFGTPGKPRGGFVDFTSVIISTSRVNADLAGDAQYSPLPA